MWRGFRLRCGLAPLLEPSIRRVVWLEYASDSSKIDLMCAGSGGDQPIQMTGRRRGRQARLNWRWRRAISRSVFGYAIAVAELILAGRGGGEKFCLTDWSFFVVIK
jgi:hypothetical protein